MFMSEETNGSDGLYLARLSLLYVEDDPMVSHLLRQFLQRRVGKLLTACNGREGLELFSEARPDLVVTDILMPEMDGLTMAESIRQIDPHVPIIITTAFNETDYLLRAIELGVEAFVVKPVKINQLLAQLRKCAKSRCLEAALHEANEVLRQILASLNEAVFIEDPSAQRIVDCNACAETLFGLGRQDIIGSPPSALLAVGNEQTSGGGTGPMPSQQRHMRHKHKGTFPCEYLTSQIQDGNGQTRYIVHVVRDISLQKRAESLLLDNQRKLKFIAHHDPLTGLSNRLLLEERLAHCLLRAKRHEISLGLLFLDLDGFKAVNDHFGHDAGDALLKAVAVRLLLAVREQDTLARFGGDEFVLLLEDLPEAAGAGEVAQKIIRTLCEPFEIEGRLFSIGVSIGLSLFPDDGEEAATLLQRADLAMYQAKQSGGRCHCRYSADSAQRFQHRIIT